MLWILAAAPSLPRTFNSRFHTVCVCVCVWYHGMLSVLKWSCSCIRSRFRGIGGQTRAHRLYVQYAVYKRHGLHYTHMQSHRSHIPRYVGSLISHGILSLFTLCLRSVRIQQCIRIHCVFTVLKFFPFQTTREKSLQFTLRQYLVGVDFVSW